jgi:MFS family permease
VDFELVSIRLIVFFAALSEELMRPFLRCSRLEVDPWALGLSPTMLVGLPVAVFMLTLAVAQPLGPWIVARVDVRRALWVCAVAGALLLLATALNRDGFWLVVLRAGSGVTYGLLLILAQTVIVRITNPSQRARGLVEVSAAIVAAGVCGPALGGLIAERTGHSVALLASAVCLLLSGVGSCFSRPCPRPGGSRTKCARVGRHGAGVSSAACDGGHVVCCSSGTVGAARCWWW